MRIGLIGPPRAGKTKFAKALSKELSDYTVVDNYVPKLAKKLGTPLGFGAADYTQHLLVAYDRLALEFQTELKTEDYIFCGTTLDSVLYTSLHAYYAKGLSHDEITAEYTRARAAMQALGMLYSDYWRHHLAFILPYSNQQIAKASELERLYNENMIPAAESFFAPYFVLDGTLDENLEFALNLIEETNERLNKDFAEADGQPVREDRANSEEVGNSLVAMSDLLDDPDGS